MANVKIDNLADEIMNGLKEYADLATDDLKKSVRKAGNTEGKISLNLLQRIREPMRRAGQSRKRRKLQIHLN